MRPTARGLSRAAGLFARLKQVARTDENVTPAMLDAVRAYATLYEIRAAMEEVFGAYQEPVFF